ncbi:hypothetical protein [Sagittula salina]|uniref:Uncharacterized protein n=1 Tax=Sagittula salina TaxID=2820268 RepID=A0A940MQU3_9RHOB|nr:hypothetical protein [Sagittula salina]MBP0481379.1 hypothetical protein [Sagittula salina]
MISRTLIPALLALPITGPALAQDGTLEALTVRADAYEALMAEGQFTAALDYMPPSLLVAVAAQAGTDPEGLRAMMGKQIQSIADTVTFDDARFDVPLDGVAVQHADGGRAFAVTTAQSAFPALGVPETTTPMLALVEDETWYFVRIESPMHGALLSQVFPDMAGPVTALKAPQ